MRLGAVLMLSRAILVLFWASLNLSEAYVGSLGLFGGDLSLPGVVLGGSALVLGRLGRTWVTLANLIFVLKRNLGSILELKIIVF